MKKLNWTLFILLKIIEAIGIIFIPYLIGIWLFRTLTPVFTVWKNWGYYTL